MANKALQHQMTRTVRVKREKLLETLKANRERHIANFDEAMDGYKKAALAKVDEAFADIHSKIDERKKELVDKINTFSPETADEFGDAFVIFHGQSIPLEVPKSFAEAYDAAIDMATFDTRDELELSGAEFQCFCRDVWDWTYEFTRTASMYNKQIQ